MSVGYTELDYINESRIPPTYSCPAGYVLIDRYCELVPNMSCPPGYSLNNGICMRQSTSNVSPMAPAMAPTSNVSPMAPSMAPTSNVSSPMAPAMAPTQNMAPCPQGFQRSQTDQMCYPIA